LYFHVHVTIALLLFALWPFTRLVHAFSAPVAYLFRPYIVYRSRELTADQQMVGSAPRPRGWEQISSPPR
jgi:nitrate reductase gamma subunit